jgi:hypothetical protein
MPVSLAVGVSAWPPPPPFICKNIGKHPVISEFPPRPCQYMYVYVCKLMYIACIYTYIQLYVCIQQYMHVYICICMYMYVYVCIIAKWALKTSKYEKQYMQAYSCVCMYMYVNVCICMNMPAHTSYASLFQCLLAVS